jgi:MFS family permease
MSAAMPSYAFAYFMPIIFEGMGWKAEKAQLMSAPPSVFTCAIGFAFAALSDRMRVRGPVIVMMACMCIVGLLTTAYSTNTNARYFGTFLGIAGSQGNIPGILSYQSNNIRTNSKRSVGSALQVGFGAIGGIFASTVFRAADAPTYVPGLWASVGCQLFIILTVGGMTVYFKAMNRKQKEGHHLENHPDFTYTL